MSHVNVRWRVITSDVGGYSQPRNGSSCSEFQSPHRSSHPLHRHRDLFENENARRQRAPRWKRRCAVRHSRRMTIGGVPDGPWLLIVCVTCLPHRSIPPPPLASFSQCPRSPAMTVPLRHPQQERDPSNTVLIFRGTGVDEKATVVSR